MSQQQQPARPIEFVKVTMHRTSDGYPVADRVLRMVPEQGGPLYILLEDGTRVFEEPPIERSGEHGYESKPVEDEEGNISQVVEVPPCDVFYASSTGLTVTYKAVVYKDTTCQSVDKVSYDRAVIEDTDLAALLDAPDAIPGVLPKPQYVTETQLTAATDALEQQIEDTRNALNITLTSNRTVTTEEARHCVINLLGTPATNTEVTLPPSPAVVTLNNKTLVNLRKRRTGVSGYQNLPAGRVVQYTP